MDFFKIIFAYRLSLESSPIFTSCVSSTFLSSSESLACAASMPPSHASQQRRARVMGQISQSCKLENGLAQALDWGRRAGRKGMQD